MTPCIQRYSFAAFDRIQGGDYRGSRGFLGRRIIRCDHVIFEIERRRNDSGILSIGKRLGCGGQIKGIQILLVLTAQAVAGGGHRHRNGIFIPVTHGPLSLCDHHQRGGKPAHGLKDRHTLQSQPRNIGAIGSDTDHVLLLLRLRIKNRRPSVS
jgi:hypothetical protein